MQKKKINGLTYELVPVERVEGKILSCKLCDLFIYTNKMKACRFKYVPCSNGYAWKLVDKTKMITVNRKYNIGGKTLLAVRANDCSECHFNESETNSILCKLRGFCCNGRIKFIKIHEKGGL